MTDLVNDLDAIVTDSIDGLVRAGHGHLTRLDGFPDVKVVLRSRGPGYASDRVAVVSGGGAGHEPAHAGLVGSGLLTAAVSGEIFASPSVEAVLAAVLAVTGPRGCLVVVKNYTGDRLSFGLAVERARALGLDVEMVVVADDVALPGAAQPRGLAGTLFVHKVAGALAEQGAPLQEVARAAAATAARVRTLGVSLTSVSIPGRPSPRRIEDGRAELGLGIHGEPGAHTIDVGSSAELVGRMAGLLAEHVPPGPVALLLNNLGGVSALEMNVVLRDLLDSELGRRARLLVGPTTLMTSLSTRGFSVSALPLDDDTADLLLAPVATATAWPGARLTSPVSAVPVPAPPPSGVPPSHDDRVHALISTVCRALVAREADLDALDARVGDGDTGSTFGGAARRIAAALDALPLADPPALLTALSDVLATAMGGSSGVLGSIFFAAAGTAAAGGAPLPAALQEGLRSVQRHGGARVGDRTMLDALAPAIDVLNAGGTLAEAADAAERGAAGTARMHRANAGRSAAVPAEHLADVEDPGAVAVAVILRAAASA